MIDKSTFCTRPWNELHIEEDGRITPCCVMPSTSGFMAPKGIKNYLRSNELKTLKENLKNGIRADPCKTCWMQEDLGYNSHRKTTLATDEKLNRIEAVHIRSTNVCNFKCRICVPELSSAWIAENKKHHLFKNKVEVMDNLLEDDLYAEELFSILKQVKQIWISGGEPLASTTTLRFFELAKKHNINNTNIAFNTNLSSLSYKNHYWLDEFKGHKVTLTVSWDGFGKQMEYHRTGIKWKKSLQNFKDSIDWIFNVNCVASIYSVYTIPKLIHFCDFVKKHLEINPIAGKDFVSLQSLPIIEKDKIKQHYEEFFKDKDTKHLRDVAWQSVIDPMYKKQLDPHLNSGFKQYNILLDKYRKTNFLGVYPEYEEWWNSINY